MKCDELKPLVFSIRDLAYVDELAVRKNFDNPHDHAVYKATEVDEAIAELKSALNEAEEARYEAGADAADYYQENRRLRKALYKACANWAKYKKWDTFTPDKDWKKWHEMSKKCLKKAEEYK